MSRDLRAHKDRSRRGGGCASTSHESSIWDKKSETCSRVAIRAPTFVSVCRKTPSSHIQSSRTGSARSQTIYLPPAWHGCVSVDTSHLWRNHCYVALECTESTTLTSLSGRIHCTSGDGGSKYPHHWALWRCSRSRGMGQPSAKYGCAGGV